jgi:hypothetical protein
MSVFESNGRVLVLGAGASAFAGYPLANGLLVFIRQNNSLEARAREIASQILPKLNDAETQFTRLIVRNPNGVANLEELLTYLDLYHSFPGTIFDLNPWTEKDSASVRRVITDRFMNYQYDLTQRVWQSGAPANPAVNIAQAWGRRLQPGDVILSFNWDILHEIIFWRSRLWSYRTGYGFQCGAQGQREEASKILLLKLHGSVNWVQNYESDSISEIANIPDFFPDSRDWDSRTHFDQAQTDSGRKLVLPTYLKDISSNKALLDIWTKAHSFLAQARELVVLGYSLNRVDHPARLLFGTGLSQNSLLRRVTVVSPGTTEWPAFLHSLGKETINVSQKFEDWVRQS